MEKKRKKVIFFESTESEHTIRAKTADKKMETVELWVRTPDSERLEKMQVAARLCSCRDVCLAVIEDDIADPI
jgi:hypothetical protein